MDVSIAIEPIDDDSIGVEAVGLLGVVTDLVRWRLVTHLAVGEPTCVCDLQTIAGVAGNLLSYHLKVLREARLVTTEKRGRWVYYTIAPDALDRLHAALPVACTLAPHTPAVPRPAARPTTPGERRQTGGPSRPSTSARGRRSA